MLLAIARITGETAPLLFTALNNQFFSIELNAPMASLPVVIFQFALSPYEDWQKLAWAGALLITLAVLALNIVARVLIGAERTAEMTRHVASVAARRPSAHRRPIAAAPAKIAVRNLDFYLRQDQALKNINLRSRRTR